MKSYNLLVIWIISIISIMLAGCSLASTPDYTPTGNPQPSQLTQLPPSPELVESTDTGDLTQITQTEASPALIEPTDPGPVAGPCSGVLTSPNMEGPYYSSGSPERNSLIEIGMPGVPILISGQVFNQDCTPISGASVDFWQADAIGEYDNSGFRLRGHVITDQAGNYAMETIEPGLYTGRPAHIHVKVFAPDGRELLTTQLYFPGSEDSPDVQAAPDLLVIYQELDDQGQQQVFFNFIVQD